jgi:hypothetical protein
MMFLANFDRTRELNIKSWIFIQTKKYTSDWQWAFFKVCLTVYKNGVDYNLKSRTDIFSCWRNSTTTPNLWNINNKTIIIPNFITPSMKVKCGFGFFIKADLKTMPPLARY